MNHDHLLAHRHGDRSGDQLTSAISLDFSVNLAPIEPPLQELFSSPLAIAPYPSMDGLGVREFYVERFGLERQCVLATNGAIEALYLMPRALGLKRVLVPQPGFFDYGRACRLAGAEVVPLTLEASSGFAFPDIDTLASALEGCDALLAGSPNNPTGTLIPKELILALACRFPDKYFIVDEAFIQFTEAFPSNSLMPEIRAFRNIAVVHSLTKFYAIAGLRLGAVIAHPSMIRRLYGHKEPWTINAIAERAAALLSSFGGFEARVRTLINGGRRQFTEGLSDNPVIRLYGGAANFFLASVDEAPGLGLLLGFLAERGILVRDCSNFESLDPLFFRFCIRTPEENRRLVSALNDFAAESWSVRPARREAAG
ncbi:MAG: threonine-phosphate decarboxylase [Chlorobiaceae bacterium]|nr:threonine-phosphate decarboxylase [Chlorobiaceae bacterium]